MGPTFNKDQVMPRATHTNYMRATLWTPTMKSEMSGTPAGVIEMAFGALIGRPKARAVLMKSLQERCEHFERYEANDPSCMIEKP